ncbi:aldo/keto reductase [Tenericutes bacterium MZ-XQ]|nr:aldo/keto reductase [Tenericutes bacterium MZ-XQ]
MRFRTFGKTGIKVSEISLGTWQLGSKWGDPFNEEVAIKTLDAAIKTDINLFDTADVYQGGMSEKVIGKYIKNLEQKPFVITKIGRRLEKHTKQGYSEKNIRNFIDDSRTNLNVKTLDMVFLHCPPTDVYYMPDVFKLLDQLKLEGKIKHYGVSVERVEEGLKAMDYEGVDAIEIIFNMFRLRPTEYFFNKAQEKKVGVIVRVPLASGLLTGKFHRQSTFEKDDHRAFNRNGEAFDKGETFSGVDYENGLDAVEALKKLFQTQNLTAIALRWILMFDAVSTVIPGASKPEYVYENVNATLLPPLTKEQMKAVEDIYEKYIKDPVHYIW